MATSGPLSMVFVALLGLLPGGEAGERRPVDFKLQDFRGAWHQLDEVKDRKLVVLAFLGTECPLANLYAPRLAELARGYEKKGVAFFGVDSNQQDAPSALARFAKDCDLPFPLLEGRGQRAGRPAGRRADARGLRARRGSGRALSRAGRRPVRLGRPPAGADPARPDRRAREPAGRPAGRHAADRAGRLQDRPGRQGSRRCEDHVLEAGRPDPARSLRRLPSRGRDRAVLAGDSYKQAAGWASMIDEVVQGGRMPPWHASPEFGKFSNEARLSAEEKQTIAAWVAAGAPEGDAEDLPEPAKYVEGWRIPAPDLRSSAAQDRQDPGRGDDAL